MQYGFKALWNYQGKIQDMGLKAGEHGQPCFFAMTEALDFIQVDMTTAVNIAMVRDWLNSLNTEVPVDFQDYRQFNQVVQEVFKVYADRLGKCLYYDNTFLKEMKQLLHVSDKTIAQKAGVGKTTVNELRRGVTIHPKYYTIGKVNSALHAIWKEQNPQ